MSGEAWLLIMIGGWIAFSILFALGVGAMIHNRDKGDD